MADNSKPTPSPFAVENRPEPGFGWTVYAEQLNGRFAMLGFVAILLIEAFTGQGLLAWLGLW
jgi:hypothetical protein